MKKIIAFAILLMVSIVSFSQQTNPSPALTKQDYLQKSKGQKIGAWILLGTGAVIFGIAAPGNVSLDVLGPLVVVGAVATLASIPLFISSAKNKRKARAATVLFKMEKTTQLQNSSFSTLSVPSLSLKFSL